MIHPLAAVLILPPPMRPPKHVPNGAILAFLLLFDFFLLLPGRMTRALFPMPEN